MNYSYQKICSDFLKDLPSRVREVVSRRFGLESGQRETLEAIGKSFGITRERVRQIEAGGLDKIRKKTGNYQGILNNFFTYFKDRGDLKREKVLLWDLGGSKDQVRIYFLLSLDKRFKRISENEDFFPLWLIDKNSLKSLQKTVNRLSAEFKKIGKPIAFKEIENIAPINETVLNSYLECSKNIQKNSDGLYGLKYWPEINPRGVKDKAYLAFKKTGKPLHFSEVTRLIDGAMVQTVHNELIRDSRFVLVGRGIYALAEWGYEQGQVKDVISRILKEAKKPLTKEEILNQVLKQRLVKENTVFLNLSNKNYFFKDSKGRYAVREI